MRYLRLLALLISLAIFGVVRPAPAETLNVFAAASLTDAFKEIGASFEKAHPGVNVSFNFEGSQILRTQIERGAPADVFASADAAQMDPLAKARLVEPYRFFAHNRLIVIAPAGKGAVRGLRDLARPGIKLVMAGPTVPAGRYALEILTKMDASGEYGDHFAAKAKANVVSQETNVRLVLSKVILGEADAGIVYLTDAATQAKKARLIKIPDRENVVAAYPIAVVAGSASKRLAQEFAKEVIGPKGRAVLKRFGFQK